MIGRLKHGDNIVTLEDDFSWSCDSLPPLGELVEVVMAGTEYDAPQDGTPGHAAYWQAVELLNAEPIEPPVPPHNDGTDEAGLTY